MTTEPHLDFSLCEGVGSRAGEDMDRALMGNRSRVSSSLMCNFSTTNTMFLLNPGLLINNWAPLKMPSSKRGRRDLREKEQGAVQEEACCVPS